MSGTRKIVKRIKEITEGRWKIGGHVYEIRPENPEEIDIFGIVWIYRDGEKYIRTPMSRFIFGHPDIEKVLRETVEN